MRKLQNVPLLLATLVAMVLLASAATGQSAPPRIFYSDLTAGPVSGGQNGAGAFVTLYGNGFGNTRGSSIVTIGGKRAVSYPIWSNTKVTFQLGSTTKSGNIVIQLPDGVSNSVPFSVTVGKIYFVSPSGRDTSSGSYVSPWRSLRAAKNRIAAGDIIYVESGVAVTTIERDGASLVLNSGGNELAPKAIIAYPGSTVTIGSSTGARTGIRITSKNWVLSGLTMRGVESSITLSEGLGSRVTSSDISCTNGHGSGACVSVNSSSELTFLGNYVHDSGDASSTNVGSYHSMAFTGSHTVEVGWNEIASTRGCNALMFRADVTPTHTVLVHDNYIHDARCEAVSLGAVDPSLGAVSLYNNVISKTGTGPAAEGAEADSGYAAIAVAGGSSTAVHAYNNTIYQAGAMGGGEAGAVRASGALELTNNIFYLDGGEQYVSMDSDLHWVSGLKNAFYGAGTPPGVFEDSIVANPELANPGSGDFHLLAGSPAINAGAALALATDVSGVLTPQNSGITIGAFEWVPRIRYRGNLIATPASFAFGNVSIGQSASATTVIGNSGTVAITVSQANSNNAQFKVSGVTFPVTVNPGESAVLTVTFTPSAAGAQSGTVSVTSNATNSPLNIVVGGTGLAAAAPVVNLSPSGLAFASQIVSTASAAQMVTLSNTGNASLTISSIVATGDFSAQSGCGTALAAGTSCSVSVTFNPTATGTRSGTLTVADNASSKTQQITLSGTGTVAQTATLQASSSSLSMGSVTVGGSGTQSVTITNTGTATATISTISSSNGAFVASGASLPATIAAGGSVTLTVAFTPTSASSYSGTLTIQSNATNQTLSISLTGTGIAAAVSHQASLTWSESSVSAVGYNVYRSTQSGTGYAKVNSSSISTTSYTDNTVSAGLTYYYVVTAVDAGGNESAYSAQISATIPTP